MPSRACSGHRPLRRSTTSTAPWADEPWFLGAPVGYPQPGALAHHGDLPLVPVGRLHWAGTDLARVNNAYMDVAIGSGERAAAEIIGRDG